MSYLEFKQEPGQLIGLSVLESPEEWDVEIPQQRSESTVSGLIKNEDGQGSWLSFDLKNSFWGSLVRSDETPYNDCLSPSEFYFDESFSNVSTPEDLTESLNAITQEDFFNPFRVIVGGLGSDQFHELNVSFQSEVNEHSSGSYATTDQKPLESINTLISIKESASQNNLPVDTNPNELLDTCTNQFTEDPMRSISCISLFKWNSDSFKIYSTDPSESNSDWDETLIELDSSSKLKI